LRQLFEGKERSVSVGLDAILHLLDREAEYRVSRDDGPLGRMGNILAMSRLLAQR
jgi:hypothetical protein